LPARLERHHARRKIRLRLRLRFARRSLQWQLPQRGGDAISKNSNGARFTLVPNGLGQSHVGLKGVEPIVSDWAVFKFENGFDPYTLQRANGPKSVVENNTTSLDAQTANGDSSRAGQLFNTEAYIGFSHPTYGEMTAGGRIPLSWMAPIALTRWARRRAFP
jgi:hypothetical protein